MDDFQIQVIWCEPTDAGRIHVEARPKKKEAGRRYLLTNMPDFVTQLFDGGDSNDWCVVDIAELYRLIFPESAAASLDEMLPGGATDKGSSRLWNLWLRCKSKLDSFPVWVLETVSVICRERDEPGLSALFALESSLREEHGGHRWLDTFPATVKKVERPALPQLEDCEKLDADEVALFLGPDGALAKRVIGYEPRPGQIQMLKAVVDAFNGGKHLMVEAGTGIGKSLAYLLPAALWAKINDVPVVVSTNTKNLQTQLVEKDLPAVLGMLKDVRGGVDDQPLRAAVIKGRGNYICLRRVAQIMDSGLFELSRPELRIFSQILCWASTTPDGDLDSLLGGASVDAEFLPNITCTSEECAGRGCRYYKRCFIQKARERALRANLIIANHSLVFSELGAASPVSLPVHAQVVFDEAHNLESAATDFFTQEISPSKLNLLLKRLSLKRGSRKSQGVLHQLANRLAKGVVCTQEPHHTLLDTAITKALAAVIDVRRRGNMLFEKLHSLVGANDSSVRYSFEPVEGVDEIVMPPAPNDKWKAVRAAQSNFRDSISTLVALLGSISDILAKDKAEDELELASAETVDLTGVSSILSEFRDSADMVLAGTDDSYVYWVQHAFGGQAMGEVCAAPINIGDFLAQKLYSKRQSVILCSATLSVGGRFNYISSRLGLDLIERGRLSTCIAPSPFDYIRQCALLMPSYLPEPVAQDRSYVTELANTICLLSEKFGGRTLCLFTSYEMLKQCARLVEPTLAGLGIRLLVHGESGSRNKLTDIFRRDERTVLFGTQSFWEGVDVVGEALSCVIVARLPFVSPGDPVFSARCEQIEKSGASSFFTLSLPAAVLKLRQGFGRLVRHRGDRGVVVIADTRIVTKNYGRQFTTSLPSPLRKCPDVAALLSVASEFSASV